ncbi:MAG: hypothetical protein V4553_18670 [Bacteroidota bacterium]
MPNQVQDDGSLIYYSAGGVTTLNFLLITLILSNIALFWVFKLSISCWIFSSLICDLPSGDDSLLHAVNTNALIKIIANDFMFLCVYQLVVNRFENLQFMRNNLFAGRCKFLRTWNTYMANN